MGATDFNDPVAITREIFWVGFYETDTGLRCNPYLILDADQAVLIDPGSIPDFPVVMRKIIDIVVPGKISHIIVSHQDPDVCGNLAVVEDVIDREDLTIVAHASTHRLIRHQGLRSRRRDVGEEANRLVLQSGRVLEFLHVPFLHAPGAICTYDARTRSLFTGDLFGAVGDDATLFAGPGFPETMKAFHQAYMPSNALVRSAMERFESMRLDRILPQHGSVLEGDQVQVAIDYLKELPCGHDLMGAPR